MDTPPGHIWGEPGNRLAALIARRERIARWVLPVMAILQRGTESSSIEPRVRNLVMLRAAAMDQAGYWLHQQDGMAGATGLSEAEREATKRGEWDSLVSLSERERAAIRWTEGVVINEAKRDRDGFAAMEEHFSRQEIVELTALVGLCAFLDRFANSLQVPMDDPPSTDAAAVSQLELERWARAMFDGDERKAG